MCCSRTVYIVCYSVHTLCTCVVYCSHALLCTPLRIPHHHGARIPVFLPRSQSKILKLGFPFMAAPSETPGPKVFVTQIIGLWLSARQATRILSISSLCQKQARGEGGDSPGV